LSIHHSYKPEEYTVYGTPPEQTKPRPHAACIPNSVKSGQVIFEICSRQKERHTNIHVHTDTVITILRTPIRGKLGPNNYNSSRRRINRCRDIEITHKHNHQIDRGYKVTSAFLQHHLHKRAQTWVSPFAFVAFWSTWAFSRNFTWVIRCLTKHIKSSTPMFEISRFPYNTACNKTRVQASLPKTSSANSAVSIVHWLMTRALLAESFASKHIGFCC